MSSDIKPGPIMVSKLVCDGCPNLVLEPWSYECENDEIDRGTDAKCAANGGRHIASYYRHGDRTPDWCPAIEPPTGGRMDE